MNTQEQHELYEKMRNRVQQKKKVYHHFILFLIGSAFIIVINKLFNVGSQFGDWYKWIVTSWFFLWLLHLINVFITNRFFGKDWERAETDKLIAKHFERLKSLEKKLVKEQIIAPDNSDSTTQYN